MGGGGGGGLQRMDALEVDTGEVLVEGAAAADTVEGVSALRSAWGMVRHDNLERSPPTTPSPSTLIPRPELPSRTVHTRAAHSIRHCRALSLYFMAALVAAKLRV